MEEEVEKLEAIAQAVLEHALAVGVRYKEQKAQSTSLEAHSAELERQLAEEREAHRQTLQTLADEQVDRATSHHRARYSAGQPDMSQKSVRTLIVDGSERDLRLVRAERGGAHSQLEQSEANHNARIVKLEQLNANLTTELHQADLELGLLDGGALLRQQQQASVSRDGETDSEMEVDQLDLVQRRISDTQERHSALDRKSSNARFQRDKESENRADLLKKQLTQMHERLNEARLQVELERQRCEDKVTATVEQERQAHRRAVEQLESKHRHHINTVERRQRRHIRSIERQVHRLREKHRLSLQEANGRGKRMRGEEAQEATGKRGASWSRSASTSTLSNARMSADGRVIPVIRSPVDDTSESDSSDTNSTASSDIRPAGKRTLRPHP